MDDLYRLAHDLDRAADGLRDKAYEVVRDATFRTQQLGKANAPVLTGRLRRSIASSMRSGPDRVEGETGPNIHYDIHVHNGTSRQAPNPFMDRAADVVEPQFYAGAEAIAASAIG